MLTTILFLIVLSILVFIHELGHFLFAKLFKVRVDEFAIGFPPKIFSFKKGETTYALNALPLGGYVKIHGENPDEQDDTKDSRNFQNIAAWKQILILSGGVLFNILFAWLLMSSLLFFGTSRLALDNVPEKYIQDSGHTVLIQQVLKNSVAEQSGLKAGQYIYTINDIQIKNTEQVQNTIKNATNTLAITVYNSTGTTTYNVIKKADTQTIGVALAEIGVVKMDVISSLYYGAKATYNMSEQIFVGVLTFFKKLFTGNGSWDEVSGPVGIAKVVGESSRQGFDSLVFITMLISISLAAMNILPFPALDGGRIVIAIIEGVLRRKLPIKFTNILNTIGFALLLILMIIVTVKDII